jgi:hypothetical protein
VIAGADQGVDENLATVAGLKVDLTPQPPPLPAFKLEQLPKNYRFHCFSTSPDAGPNRAFSNIINADVIKNLDGPPPPGDDLKTLATTALTAARVAVAAADAAIATAIADPTLPNFVAAVNAVAATKAPLANARVAVGVYLHCQQDRWSHVGYGDVTFPGMCNPVTAKCTAPKDAIGAPCANNGDCTQRRSIGHTLESAFDLLFDLKINGLNVSRVVPKAKPYVPPVHTSPDHPAIRREDQLKIEPKGARALVDTRVALNDFRKTLDPAFGGGVALLQFQKLIDALTDQGLNQMSNRLRRQCVRHLAQHWLFATLTAAGSLNKVPNQAANVRNFVPSMATSDDLKLHGVKQTCTTIYARHFANDVGPLQKEVIIPAPAYPQLSVTGQPKFDGDNNLLTTPPAPFLFDLTIALPTDINKAPQGVPGRCRYSAGLHVKNAGLAPSPPAKISMYVVPADSSILPSGDTALIAGLSPGSSLDGAFLVDGPCAPAYALRVNVGPQTDSAADIESWFEAASEDDAGGDAFAAVIDPSKCAAKKAIEAGKEALAKAKCESKAVRSGVVVDPTCLTKAELKLAGSFTKADNAADCLVAGGDAEAVGAIVESFMGALADALEPGPGPSTCNAKKLAAAGKAASSSAICAARPLKRGDDYAKTVACLQKADAKLAILWSKAETAGDCLGGSDDLDGVRQMVESFVSELQDQLVRGSPAGSPNGAFLDAEPIS